MAGAPDLAWIARKLAEHGLSLRSGFNFDAGEDAPARAVILVGHAGAAYWPHFQTWLAEQSTTLADPLDTWSRAVIGGVAAQVGARAVSPSDRPYQPFQRWAMRAEGLKPSPLGILMHPEYGLWHAYRGALLFDCELPFPPSATPPHLCDTCESKACLHACPVGAYSTDGFAYDACLSHVRSGAERGNHLATSKFPTGIEAGEVVCATAGCLDRNACPVGAAYRYPAAVQAFHMAAFARI